MGGVDETKREQCRKVGVIAEPRKIVMGIRVPVTGRLKAALFPLYFRETTSDKRVGSENG